MMVYSINLLQVKNDGPVVMLQADQDGNETVPLPFGVGGVEILAHDVSLSRYTGNRQYT